MKMKTVFISMFALAAMLAGCNNSEDDLGSKHSVAEGIPTTARMVLSQRATNTRATEGANPDESAIKTVTVYVFKNDGILEKAVTFGGADITAGSKVFAITSGVKSIYAAVNIPPAQLTGITENSTSLTAFQKKIVMINATTDATTPVATGDGWWMTNIDAAVSTTLLASVSEADASNDVSNSVTIPVGRATAKVSMELSPTATVIDGAFALTGYKMANNARKNYLMPVIVDGVYTTPNYNETTVTAGDYFKQPSFLSGETYTTENTHANPVFANATTAIIRGVFTPAAVLAKDGTPSTLPASGDFWRIRKGDYTYTAGYYAELPNQTEIDAKTGNDAAAIAVKYTGGVCYYRLLVADNSKTTANEKFTVIRNNFYQITIVNVNGAGSDTEEGIEPGQPGQPDPTDPVEQTTNMKATIQILPWTVIKQNGGI